MKNLLQLLGWQKRNLARVYRDLRRKRTSISLGRRQLAFWTGIMRKKSLKRPKPKPKEEWIGSTTNWIKSAWIFRRWSSKMGTISYFQCENHMWSKWSPTNTFSANSPSNSKMLLSKYWFTPSEPRISTNKEIWSSASYQEVTLCQTNKHMMCTSPIGSIRLRRGMWGLKISSCTAPSLPKYILSLKCKFALGRKST